jgi:hypothetical protein
MVVRPALGPLRQWDPERIGPYVLLGRLGAGAMGQVFTCLAPGAVPRPWRRFPAGRRFRTLGRGGHPR